ncbi:MAG TPA: neutral/alkaline non-lysosomal ceramidase N-terminal domain-containing protein, partial [Polyangiaceae bacterium]|nr:neutral/alkaline non-lysosomal ceramidase N-terminal domain-containing protein [Polyangiaceae bacterium]
MRTATVGVAFVGCANSNIVVTQPCVEEVRAPKTLRAGVAKSDITPPAGVPIFGYSLGAKPRSQGYRGRLFARAFVLESTAFASKKGERIALVQVDLGAPSALVKAKVVARLAKHGLGIDNTLLMATHTHGGPKGYFGASFYNTMGSATPGFDASLTGWLSQRIADTVVRAVYDLRPARIGTARAEVSNVTYNRSLPAWTRNPEAEAGAAPEVDSVLRLVRIDRADRGEQRPLGVFAVFAIHGTALPPSSDLAHADVLGTAAFKLEALVGQKWPVAGKDHFVAMFANGAEGDVSPLPDGYQGVQKAIRIGDKIANGAYRALGTIREVDMSGAVELGHAHSSLVVGTDVCEPAIGVSTLAGAEDGRSSVFGHLGIREGRTQTPNGCHAEKVH